MKEKEVQDQYEKPELAKIDNIKDITFYDSTCNCSVPGGRP